MGFSVRGRGGAAGAGFAALLLAGAVGCGAEKSPEMTPAAAVAKAAEKSEDITSLSYRMTGEIPGEGRIEGEAAMSVKPLAMSMTMTMPDEPELDGAVEVRLVDEQMYIGGEAMAEQLDGKSWMKFDASELGAEAGLGSDAGGLGRTDQNPAAESGFLAGADDVEKVCAEKIEGVQTTHYKGTVTFDQLRKTLKDEDEETRELREKSLKQYEDMGVEKLTMDMWVDGEDHTKQFRMRADADKGPLDMTIVFLDYNKPVTVKAPPAKDTMDLAEMMKELATAQS